MARPRLLFLVPEDWYFWTHRRALALAAKTAGFDVTVATRVHDHGPRIEGLGLRLVPIRLRRRSRNPIRELFALADLVQIYRRERPTLVHQVTPKSVIYGSCAATLARVPAIVNVVVGWGSTYEARGWGASILNRLMALGYRAAFTSRRSRVIFQNPEDLRMFVSKGIVSAERTILIRGVGVDLDDFRVLPEPRGTPVVMFAGRLQWNKGVGDLVEAGKLLRSQGIDCRIVLVGIPDTENSQAVPESVLRRWAADGAAERWGRREDMPAVIAQSHLVVLPTTRGEGVPKILLEAGAVGRAAIATDMAGCREVIRHGENGLLTPPRDVPALARAIADLLGDSGRRSRMGLQGRAIVEREFAQAALVGQTIGVYQDLLQQQRLSIAPPHD